MHKYIKWEQFAVIVWNPYLGHPGWLAFLRCALSLSESQSGMYGMLNFELFHAIYEK